MIPAHAIGFLAASRPPTPAGVLTMGANFKPVYREDALTTRWYSPIGNVQKDDDGGPFGGPCAVFGASGTPGLVYGGAQSEIYLSNSDFTVECWIAGSGSEPASEAYFFSHWSTNAAYRTWTLDYNPGSNLMRFRLRTSASSTTRTASFAVSDPATFFNGTWHHIAAVRNSGTVTIYVDGVAGATTYAISTTALRDPNDFYRPGIGCFHEEMPGGCFFGGKVTECRLSTVARYTSGFTPPTAAFPRGSIDDANWSSVLILMGMNGDWGFQFTGEVAPLTAADMIYPTAGSTTITTGVIEGNGATVQNFPSGAHLRFNSPAEIEFGTDDFTFECIFNAATTSTNAYFLGLIPGNLVVAFYRAAGSPVRLEAHISTNGSSSALTLDTTDPGTGDHHIALTRQGSNFRFYLNGTLVDSGTLSGALRAVSGGVFRLAETTIDFHIKGIRIINDAAIYTGASHTVPGVEDLLALP